MVLPVAFALPVGAQTASPPGAVAHAVRLRDAGDLAGAALALRSHLAQHPTDGDATRLLAQTLYWSKDVAGALAVYEVALPRNPGDWALRLEYGRMLAETGDAARARGVVEPLTRVTAARGQAEALLGTLAYWQGDLGGAKRRLTAALNADPAQPEARRQLREIAVATAPWLRLSSDLGRDDQPLDRLGWMAEGGWHPTPLSALAVRVRSARLRSGDSISLDLTGGEVSLSHYVPMARLELEGAGGALRRSGSATADWTGRVGLGLRLPGRAVLGVQAERAPYLYSLASLDTVVVSRTVTARLDWSHPRGWLGQAALQRQRYPDANTISMAHVWALAPVLRRTGAELQLGYSASAQDAKESRFVLAAPQQPFAPHDPRFRTEGRYSPYYTPSNLVTQAVLAAASFRPAPALTARASGSYGIRAAEDAPVFSVTTGAAGPAAVERRVYRRDFAPWTARAAIEVRPSGDWELALTGEALRTAFYTASSVGLQATYRFVGAATRRIDRDRAP